MPARDVPVVCPGSGGTADVHVGLSVSEGAAGGLEPPHPVNAAAIVAMEIPVSNGDQPADLAIVPSLVDYDFPKGLPIFKS
jgi:hypothetical protein